MSHLGYLRRGCGWEESSVEQKHGGDFEFTRESSGLDLNVQRWVLSIFTNLAFIFKTFLNLFRCGGPQVLFYWGGGGV